LFKTTPAKKKKSFLLFFFSKPDLVWRHCDHLDAYVTHVWECMWTHMMDLYVWSRRVIIHINEIWRYMITCIHAYMYKAKQTTCMTLVHYGNQRNKHYLQVLIISDASYFSVWNSPRCLQRKQVHMLTSVIAA
jgi:hypothetical protein